MNKIEEGKMYNIYFEMLVPISEAKLLYMPCSTGEAWRFEKDGNEIAIGYFAKLEPFIPTPEINF